MNRPLAWLLGLLLTACSPPGSRCVNVAHGMTIGSLPCRIAFRIIHPRTAMIPLGVSYLYRMIGVSRGISPSITPSTPGGGALPGGIGWYRKTFTLPETDRGKVVMLISTGFTGIARSGSTVIRWDSVRMVMYRFVMT